MEYFTLEIISQVGISVFGVLAIILVSRKNKMGLCFRAGFTAILVHNSLSAQPMGYNVLECNLHRQLALRILPMVLQKGGKTMSRSDISRMVETLEKNPQSDDLQLKVLNCFLGHPTEIRRGGFMPKRMDIRRPDHLEIFMAAVLKKFQGLKEELPADQHQQAEIFFNEASAMVQS